MCWFQPEYLALIQSQNKPYHIKYISDDVHTRMHRYLTDLKSESHCVILNAFHSHLPLSQQRSIYAKCTHKHVSVDMAQWHPLA